MLGVELSTPPRAETYKDRKRSLARLPCCGSVQAGVFRWRQGCVTARPAGLPLPVVAGRDGHVGRRPAGAARRGPPYVVAVAVRRKVVPTLFWMKALGSRLA